MLNNKFVELWSNFVNFISFKEYDLRIDDYNFNEKEKDYFIIVKNRSKRSFTKVKVSDILNYRNVLDNVHPYDAYIIGVLNRVVTDKNINLSIDTIKHINLKHNNERVPQSILYMGINFDDKVLFLKMKNSNNIFNVSLKEFLANPYILRSLSGEHAFSLGFAITEFIADE